MSFENSPFFFGGPGSDLANYLGLILTIVGFAITIISVRKSNRTSEEAKKEVIKVREDIKRIDIVNDLSSAVAMLEEIRTLQRECTWVLLPDRYAALKKFLISIKNSYPTLTDEQKSSIQSTLQHVSDMDEKIELALKNGKEPDNIPKFNKILAKQKDELFGMLVELRKSIGAKAQ